MKKTFISYRTIDIMRTIGYLILCACVVVYPLDKQVFAATDDYEIHAPLDENGIAMQARPIFDLEHIDMDNPPDALITAITDLCYCERAGYPRGNYGYTCLKQKVFRGNSHSHQHWSWSDFALHNCTRRGLESTSKVYCSNCNFIFYYGQYHDCAIYHTYSGETENVCAINGTIPPGIWPTNINELLLQRDLKIESR